MQPLLHSPFLLSLGYAIINSLWQFALLWLLYFSTNSLLKLSSHQKYVTGLALQLAGFAWFLGTFLFYHQLPVSGQSLSTGHLILLAGNTATSVQHKFLLVVVKSEQFFPYLAVAYLALLFILTLRWVYAYSYTQQVRTNGLSEADAYWKVFVQKLSRQLNITRPVHIYLSALVQTPLTAGFFKPVILIPLATINYLSQQQMEAVILHEMAHIKRFDYLFNLLLALTEACLFFNPFMQLINHQIKKERENCCDDWVLKYNYSAPSYARALLQIAACQMRSPVFALKATDNKYLLINRIKRIIEKKERPFFNYKHQLLALLVMTLVFSLFSFLLPATKTTLAFSSKTKYRAQSVAAKVSDRLFSHVSFLTNSTSNINSQSKPADEIKQVPKDVASNLLNPSNAESGDQKEDADIQLMNGMVNENTEPLNGEMIGSENKIAFNLPVLQNREKKDIKLEEDNKPAEEPDKQTEPADNAFKNSKSAQSGKEITIETLDKVRLQLKNALIQLKQSQKGTERMKLQRLSEAVTEINEMVSAAPPSTREVFKLYELALLETQIKTAIDTTNLPLFYTTGFTDDVNFNFNFQVPAVIQRFSHKEKPHSFSFEYHLKPTSKSATIKTLKEIFKAKKGRDKGNATEENDDDEMSIKAPLPPTPPAGAAKVYSIRI